MGKSKPCLVDDMSVCMMCGAPNPQYHHVLYGVANRKLSDKYGYIVPLCRYHHTGDDGVHHDRIMDLMLKRKAQKHFEENHGDREDFIRVFGKNYL